MVKIFLSILVAASAMLAQSRATISGTVTDSTGAAMAGAKVIATSTETNIATTAVTNSSGIYLIQNLEIGAYTVTVEHEGFRRFRESGIVLQTAESLRVCQLRALCLRPCRQRDGKAS